MTDLGSVRDNTGTRDKVSYEIAGKKNRNLYIVDANIFVLTDEARFVDGTKTFCSPVLLNLIY